MHHGERNSPNATRCRCVSSFAVHFAIITECRLRGETTHDQHINRAVSQGFYETSVQSGVPVLFGVLTCDTLEQAIHRSGGNHGNKGAECALAALEMVDLLRQLPR